MLFIHKEVVTVLLAATTSYLLAMIIISRYVLRQEKDDFRVINRDLPRCPRCNTIMVGYDTRKRQLIDESGKHNSYLLRRLKCPMCDVLHLEIPDFIVPHKHYNKAVISSVQRGNDYNCPADDSTIRRWKQNHPPILPVRFEMKMVSYMQNIEKGGEEE